MTSFFKWLKGTADYIAAGMLAAMFATFIIQILSRYLLDLSLSWTVELCLTLWLWLVFWVSAFCAKDSDQIRFDVLYLSVSKRARKIIGILSALTIIVAFGYSLLPTIDYLWFYKIKKSPVMRIPLHYIFSIYGIFLIAIIVRYVWRIYELARNDSLEQVEEQINNEH